jgi:RNA polymerase sigma-70 factor (ECF subfamily)
MDADSLSRSLEGLRPTLMRIARLQLRNDSWVEDVVSETMLAAIESAASFSGDSQVKTWVVGILKHKIVDQLRRGGREVSVEAQMEAAGVESLDEMYQQSGHKLDPPREWSNPESALSQSQFFDVLQACVERLPANMGRIFMMREWLEYETDQICKELDITSTNCFVMLHRARMRLRECLEMNWFATERGR